jgi:hypothetical protein
MSFVVAAVGVGVGVAKLVGASKRKKAAKKAAAKAAKELAAKKKQYEALDTSNLNKNMENKMEDLTINQKGMELQSQKSAQSRANVMEGMKDAAGGSGIAALAQTMANKGSEDAAKEAAMIGDQEAANQKASSQEASKIQDAKIKGEEASRSLKYQKTSNLMGMAAGEKDTADAAKTQASKDQMNAIGGIATSVVGSDRRLKKNIQLAGTSPSGLNIYHFEYIDTNMYGEGTFQGVMADEVPLEAIEPKRRGEKYDYVNYDMIDVEFKQI